MKNFVLILHPFPEEIQDIVFGIAEFDVKRQCYKIVIDSTRDEETQTRTLKHELSHILLGHHHQLWSAK